MAGTGRAAGFGFAMIAALMLAACSSGPPLVIYDITPSQPPATRPLRAQVQIGAPVASLDLDGEMILVRDGLTLSTLPGGRWPQQLTSLFRQRLIASFQNAGLTRSLAGGGAQADYELDTDIRNFEVDAQTSEVHIDIAARVVDLRSGRVVDVRIFTIREPVTPIDAPTVAAALDHAANEVMTRIVAFTARTL
jgi:cholesterol transport system auxiliary component